MPQLDFFFFLGESVITLVLLYTTIYFYLFWFSKQNFEYWIVSARFNYYFEKQLFYISFVNSIINVSCNNDIKNFYEFNSSLGLWEDSFLDVNAME